MSNVSYFKVIQENVSGKWIDYRSFQTNSSGTPFEMVVHEKCDGVHKRTVSLHRLVCFNLIKDGLNIRTIKRVVKN